MESNFARSRSLRIGRMATRWKVGAACRTECIGTGDASFSRRCQLPTMQLCFQKNAQRRMEWPTRPPRLIPPIGEGSTIESAISRGAAATALMRHTTHPTRHERNPASLS